MAETRPLERLTASDLFMVFWDDDYRPGLERVMSLCTEEKDVETPAQPYPG